MLDKEQFFKEFSIDKEYFESTGLVWDELVKIYDNYVALVLLNLKRKLSILYLS